MNFNFSRFCLWLVVGGCSILLALLPSQCQGARYSNSLDLNENEMTSLLDELSLPQHRIIPEKPKPYPWHNLLRRGDHFGGGGMGDHHPVYYDYERPVASTRRRRIVVKMKKKRRPTRQVT